LPRVWVPEERRAAASPASRWRDILSRWSAIKLDIHEVFGVDLDDPDVRARKSWGWAIARIEGLLTMPCRLITPGGKARPANRLQATYWPE